MHQQDLILHSSGPDYWSLWWWPASCQLPLHPMSAVYQAAGDWVFIQVSWGNRAVPDLLSGATYNPSGNLPRHGEYCHLQFAILTSYTIV